MSHKPDPATFIRVRTTLPRTPLPQAASRPELTTDRLLIRPVRASDLEDYHALCQEEAVMTWMKAGRPNASLEESRAQLEGFLPGNENYEFAILLRGTGEFIGLGGCSSLSASFGWPKVGYMLREEAWGKGYATEFLRAFLAEYVALPRAEVEILVDPRSVEGRSRDGGDGVPEVEEELDGSYFDSNEKSGSILKKCGFEHFLDWQGIRGTIHSFRS